MKSFIEKVIGTEHDRQLKKYKGIVGKINEIEPEMAKLTDVELQGKTDVFKKRLEDGEKLEDLKVEAFAVVREAAKRVLGLRPFDVQLIGGLAMCDNDIAEMGTGEGKTLVASLPGYYRALEGKGVHVITVNDYLAVRDSKQIGQIYEFLQMTVGLNIAGMDNTQKQVAYEADITYGVSSEFGFDHLRDHMVTDPSQRALKRPYHFVIIDEVDSVLIDEAKTPLIIAGKTDVPQSLYGVATKIARSFEEGKDYEHDYEAGSVVFNDLAITKIERSFGIDNLYDITHQTLFHYMLQALRAHVLYRKDVEYIIQEDEVILIDMFTGRTMEGRTLSDGLHQAIEAKEGVPITQENKTQAMITIQNYFRLYPNIAGMTGTAMTEKREFKMLYDMNVIPVPPNKPRIREDEPDHVYMTKEQKYHEVVKKVQELHAKRQPVLVGTTSIIQSDMVAAYFEEAGLPFELLNAKSVEKEVELISNAGVAGQITIATNMAGRGTDIVPDQEAVQVGGLFVLGTEKHESRRIDNQLRGRAGRQGDPGKTAFYVSIDDDMMKRFAREEVESWQSSLKTNDDGLILDKEGSEFIEKTQKISEDANYAMREYTLKLDDVLNEQRNVMYKLRNKVLYKEDLNGILRGMIQESLDDIVEWHCPDHALPEEWDLDSLAKELNRLLPQEMTAFPTGGFDERDELEAFVNDETKAYLAFIEKLHEDQLQDDLKMILLGALDRNWLSHIERMNRLKEGIGLRSYQQEDPMRVYLREGYEVFQNTYADIRKDTAGMMIQFLRIKKQDLLKEAELVKE